MNYELESKRKETVVALFSMVLFWNLPRNTKKNLLWGLDLNSLPLQYEAGMLTARPWSRIVRWCRWRSPCFTLPVSKAWLRNRRWKRDGTVEMVCFRHWPWQMGLEPSCSRQVSISAAVEVCWGDLLDTFSIDVLRTAGYFTIRWAGSVPSTQLTQWRNSVS
jgi:hypothetical protein